MSAPAAPAGLMIARRGALEDAAPCMAMDPPHVTLPGLVAVAVVLTRMSGR